LTGEEARISDLGSVIRLLHELLACSLDRRSALLREERFQNPGLLVLLLEECQAALPFDPPRADEAFAMATPLFGLLDRDLGSGLFEAKCHFYSLRGTVRRLLGDYQGAETLFAQAAVLEVNRPAQGFLCRRLGLLRWDQGRFAEAAALLYHAADLLLEADYALEASVCLALVGLLALERIDFIEAEGVLKTAIRDLDSRERPWIACEVALGLSLIQSRGNPSESRANRDKARKLYAQISHEQARVGLNWLEGRVALGLSEHERAVQLLESVRRKFLADRWFPEATLATFDLAQALAESGRDDELEPLVDDLTLAFEGRPKLEMALLPLLSFADQAQAFGPDRHFWLCSSSALRQLFRADGIFLQPVPFA